MSNALVVFTKVHVFNNIASKSPKKMLFLTAHIGMVAADLETDGSLSAVLAFISQSSVHLL
jgi:hypothetical protein